MLREIWFEIRKIAVQKKNYVMIFGHLLFLALCYIGFKTSNFRFFEKGVEGTIKFDNFQRFVDGLFFARVSLVPTFLVLMPIFICTLAGDMVAGEMQDGSLKLYMARPRSRTRIILSKLSAIYLVNLLYCLYFAVVAIVVGICLRGYSDTQLVYLHGLGLGSEMVLMPAAHALVCYFLVVIYYSVSMMALGSIAFFFSTIFDRMSGATVVAITVYFVCYIVEKLPFADRIEPYLLSKVMNGGSVLWLTDIPYGRLVTNLSTLAIYIAFFCMLSIINFNVKDIK